MPNLLTYTNICVILTKQPKEGCENMSINIQGYIKLSLLDFPGTVSCTVFTGGCNLRCPFCHNAGLVKTPGAEQNAEGEVLDYLKKRQGVLDGVCVTGGEPLLQPHLSDFLREVKKMNYLIKLDTNGSLPEALKNILSENLADYVAMDIKSSPDGYHKASGSELPFEIFAESMRVIRESNKPYEFRTTAVKGIHEKEDFLKIASLLLPDEKYFIQSFTDSGNILGGGCSPFTNAEMHAILDEVKKILPRAALRGQD